MMISDNPWDQLVEKFKIEEIFFTCARRRLTQPLAPQIIILVCFYYLLFPFSLIWCLFLLIGFSVQFDLVSVSSGWFFCSVWFGVSFLSLVFLFGLILWLFLLFGFSAQFDLVSVFSLCFLFSLIWCWFFLFAFSVQFDLESVSSVWFWFSSLWFFCSVDSFWTHFNQLHLFLLSFSYHVAYFSVASATEQSRSQ